MTFGSVFLVIGGGFVFFLFCLFCAISFPQHIQGTVVQCAVSVILMIASKDMKDDTEQLVLVTQ